MRKGKGNLMEGERGGKREEVMEEKKERAKVFEISMK